MNFEKYVSSFKREEIARIWVHMTAMTLTIARRENSRSLLVVEGAEREDESGEVTTEPLILGEIEDKNRLKEVARLVLDNNHEIAVQGNYSWALIQSTHSTIESALWSICWTKDDNDENGYLPSFLMKLNESQISTLMMSVENPCDLIFLENIILISRSFEISTFCIENFIEFFGEIIDVEWCAKAAQLSKNEIQKFENKLALAASEKMQKKFGDPKFVSDARAVVEKFRDKIPGGILLHMTKFAPPKLDDDFDMILCAWNRAADMIPSCAEFSMEGRSWLPGYLIVIGWLITGREQEVFDRLRSSTDPRIEQVILRLKKISAAGNKTLSEGHLRHAQGLARAKYMTRFDPDLWR